MKTVQLENAQEIAKEHPETFNAPSRLALRRLVVGDSIKVCCAGERFWVTVTELKEGSVVGTIDNDLVFSHRHGLMYKDKLLVKHENIYSIY